MAAIDTTAALAMVKARLNRLPEDTTLDDYLEARIDGAIDALEATGIVLTPSAEDLMLVVDYSVFEYQSRDKQGGMPEWLKRRVRFRWVQQEVAQT